MIKVEGLGCHVNGCTNKALSIKEKWERLNYNLLRQDAGFNQW